MLQPSDRGGWGWLCRAAVCSEKEGGALAACQLSPAHVGRQGPGHQARGRSSNARQGRSLCTLRHTVSWTGSSAGGWLAARSGRARCPAGGGGGRMSSPRPHTAVPSLLRRAAPSRTVRSLACTRNAAPAEISTDTIPPKPRKGGRPGRAACAHTACRALPPGCPTTQQTRPAPRPCGSSPVSGRNKKPRGPC